ncbi:protein of unknown function DUF187 [Gloeothece citriformis PCC 7424]|uniref:Glycosyl hydrolase-like 10 domain-containing protein n=1 Tax=Gloeothece citriformis (strain PCC 7424) TaxID=65393 RepID=B7KHQ9_GLOC7|nr:glycoside hydrolase family 10 protein [Gloeothece citriformis]ACK72006.1 protein of unknown function DUF187 [Gloeothece citriformis PCC 7424]
MKRHFLKQFWQSFRKFKFIYGFLASLLGILWLGNPIMAFSPPTPGEIRGVWITTNDTNTFIDQPKVKDSIAKLARLHFNTLYPVVWNSGYALYESGVAQRAGIQPFIPRGLQGQDTLKDIIDEAHQQGLQVMPWFEFGFMAPPSSELAMKHPRWLTQRRDGSNTTRSAAGEVVWLNPFHPEVQQFITNLVVEVATKYDIDGIQFDDHLCLPHELGYDPYTINLYKQETEQDPPADPKDPAWMRWRADKLTAFVTNLNLTLKSIKPKAIFSLSPNPYHVAYNSFLQDWVLWIRQNLIDELIVQVYRPDLSAFIRELTRPEMQEARQKIPTGVGILTGLRNRPIPIQFIEEKVLTARQYNFGVSFFFYDSLWNYAPEPPPERQSRFLSLFPSPINRPVREIPVAPIVAPIIEETANPSETEIILPPIYEGIPIPVYPAW